MQRLIAVLGLLMVLAMGPAVCFAQSAGGACSPNGSTVAGAPGASGQNLICTSATWQIVSVAPTLPSGMIAAFASTTCPTGWTEYTAARGRFLRGLDNGAGLDPSGTRVPGGLQLDAVQNVTSTLAAAGAVAWQGASGAMYLSGGTAANPTGSSGGGNTVLNFDASRIARTASETRPANVAVLFCSKN